MVFRGFAPHLPGVQANKSIAVAGWRGWWVPGLLLAPLLTACPSRREETPSTSGSVLALPSSSASARPPAQAWYVGRWRGSYVSKKQDLEVAADAGRLRNWDEDDASVGVGEGRVELLIDPAGHLVGSSSGPLGDLGVSGAVDDETVRLRLLPRPGSTGLGFSGYVVASGDKGSRLTGTLRAASGDSALVRSAQVVLEKQGK